MKSQDLTSLHLPDKPGVYFFRDSEGKILYIGKATSLRDRVKSYFGKDLIATRGPALVDMVTKAHTVTFEVTDSVLEALIAEANLIKHHQPYYNVKEKDDKSFYTVVITNEPMPKVLLVRERNLKNGTALTKKPKYTFGPFPNGQVLREALRIVRKMFPFIDGASVQKDTYEFYRQLGLTPDTRDEEAKKHYAKTITHIRLLFQGKKDVLVKKLTKEMHTHARHQRFEQALAVKKTLFALQHIKDISLIKKDTLYTDAYSLFRIEGYDVAHIGGKHTYGVMTVVHNTLPMPKEYRSFKIRTARAGSDTHALREVLERRLAHTEWTYPHLIVADGGTAQKNTLELVLKQHGIRIPVVAVTKDERHKPKALLGLQSLITQHEKEIVLANSEAHRFSLRLHRKDRGKNFKKGFA